MAEQNQQVAAKPKTLIGKTISLPFTLFGLLCGSLFLSIFFEWIGLYFFWPEQGWYHAEKMFYTELEQLSSTFRQSIFLSDPVQFANKLLTTAYDWIFVKTGLLQQLGEIVTSKSTDSLRKLTFREYISVAVGQGQNYLLAAAYVTLTFLVRLFILILSTPLIFLAVFVGFVDGLVKRDIRRFVAGHESGFVYHRAKAFLIPTITLPWVIYLAIPVSISPLLIMIPCAVMAGVVMNITASSFKKYL